MTEEGRKPVYSFDKWEVDLGKRELRADGTPVTLGSRSFDVLEALLASPDALVTKDHLLHQVWPGIAVEDNTLQAHISAIRRAFGSDRGLLKTASGRGYRLLGEWTRHETQETTQVAHEAPPAIGLLPSNIPELVAELIGRAEAVQAVLEMVSAHRLTTLTGAGGIGKSSLAVEAARRERPAFNDQIWLVDLAPLSDPRLVASAISGTLGVAAGGQQISAASVADAIADRRLLLVLDNCEHLIDAVARLVDTVLERCPQVTVLATSRDPMRIVGEYTYPVEPLSLPQGLPDDIRQASSYSAVKLFVERVRAVKPDYVADQQALTTIVAICRHLDGIPLAIELAATHTIALGVEQILARLDDRFALLTNGRRTALPRHQTLRAALDWSYELLSSQERHVLRRLAIFAGGFTLDAATCVIDGTVAPSPGILDDITDLVTKSLVVSPKVPAEPRWHLLETTRAYALEKLAESAETDIAARRHAEHYAAVFAPTDDDDVIHPTAARLSVYRREIDNVRSALDWAFGPNGDIAIGARLTAAYLPVWLDLLFFAECRERAEQALDRLVPGVTLSPRLEMQLRTTLGIALVYTNGTVERARSMLADALDVAETLDDDDALLQVLYSKWIVLIYNGEIHAAERLARRLSDLAHRSANPAYVLLGDRLIGHVLHYSGDQPRARRHLERVVDQYQSPTDQNPAIWLHYDHQVLARAVLARVLWLQGLPRHADRVAHAALADAHSKQHMLSACFVLGIALGPITLLSGDVDGADRIGTDLNELAAQHGFTFWSRYAQCLAAQCMIRRGEVDEGTALLRDRIGILESTGQALHTSDFVSDLAEGLRGLNKADEAQAVVTTAIQRAEATGVRWHLAELLRLDGELKYPETTMEPSQDAEEHFRRVISLAQAQGAAFWELRAALSLARRYERQDRLEEAQSALQAAYERFEPDADIEELRSARLLLAALHERGAGPADASPPSPHAAR